MDSRPIKLHLGCGQRKLHGYINVDIREDVKPELVMDITRIAEAFPGNADVIYACHVLEHFPRKPFQMSQKTFKDVLQNWYKALKPGGILRISVPNIYATCKYIVERGSTGALDEVISFLYGGEKHDYDFHYHGWDFTTLERDLKEIGFTSVKPYDWQKTEHFYVDDYSQAYLPHMDKVNGTLLSLNVEATK